MTVLLTGGTVIDGSGNQAFPGDVLVEGERILDVGPVGTLGVADQTVDATGKFVTPGFIDFHAHSDAYLVLEPDAPSKITQGVTTEVNGQCGGSVAPRYGEARLSSDWASLLGDKLTWRSLGEYRTQLEAVRPIEVHRPHQTSVQVVEGSLRHCGLTLHHHAVVGGIREHRGTRHHVCLHARF